LPFLSMSRVTTVGGEPSPIHSGHAIQTVDVLGATGKSALLGTVTITATRRGLRLCRRGVL
jgi:hypothetical protein